MYAGILRFLITAAVIPLCAHFQFMDGVTLVNMNNTIVLGVILAVGYTLLRPVVRLLLKVVNFCTLGLLYVVVDGWLIQLAARRVDNSVIIKNFWWALALALLINVGRTLVDMVTGKTK